MIEFLIVTAFFGLFFGIAIGFIQGICGYANRLQSDQTSNKPRNQDR